MCHIEGKNKRISSQFSCFYIYLSSAPTSRIKALQPSFFSQKERVSIHVCICEAFFSQKERLSMRGITAEIKAFVCMHGMLRLAISLFLTLVFWSLSIFSLQKERDSMHVQHVRRRNCSEIDQLLFFHARKELLCVYGMRFFSSGFSFCGDCRRKRLSMYVCVREA